MDVSFIIPTYNDGLFLGECLDSLCRLRGKDYEFIVVDDGSTDNVPDICEKYRKADPRVHVIRQQNRGVSAARNEGLLRASGKWLCFVDGDDLIIPENFENEILPSADESCDVVYFEYDEKIGETIAERGMKYTESLIIEDDLLTVFRCGIMNLDDAKYKQIKAENITLAAPWGKIYKHKFVKKTGCKFKEGIIRAQDQLFNAELLCDVQKVKIVPVKGYIYRGRGGNPYRYNPRLIENDAILLDAYDALYKKVKDKRIRESYEVWKAAHIITLMRLEFCNPTNPKKYLQRRKDFLEYVSRGRIRRALLRIRKTDISSSKWKVLLLIKKKMFFALDIYYRNVKLTSFYTKMKIHMDAKSRF